MDSKYIVETFESWAVGDGYRWTGRYSGESLVPALWNFWRLSRSGRWRSVRLVFRN